MRRLLLLTAPLLALVWSLAGCGGGSHDVAHSPSSAPPPASSPAPASTAPSAPAHETAEQFIRRWVKANTNAQRTGDLTAWDAMNQPGCQSCRGFDKAVKRIYDAGGVVEPSETQILWIRKHPDGYYSREHLAASRYRESTNAPWKHFAGGTDTQIYDPIRIHGEWRMAKYSQLSGSSR